ncbi:hypothetical protein KY289_013284 [Solanum tuberosum]|nr:hypothetical protein KY289_013284 [Solanum tuberosum]
MDGGITDGDKSGQHRTQIVSVYEKTVKGNNSPPLDTHLSDFLSNLDGGNTNNNQSIQPTKSVMNLSKGTSRNVQDIDRNGSFPNPSAGYNGQLGVIHTSGVNTIHEEANLTQEMKFNAQKANDQINRKQTTESLAREDQSLNFSFGIRGNSMNTTPNVIPYVMQDKTPEKSRQDQQEMNEQTSQRYQTKGKEVQSGKPISNNCIQTDANNTEAHLHNVVNEKISRIVALTKQVSNQGYKDKEGQRDQNKDANQ